MRTKTINCFTVAGDCINLLTKNFKFVEVTKEQYNNIITGKGIGIATVTGENRNTIAYYRPNKVNEEVYYVCRYAVIYTAIYLTLDYEDLLKYERSHEDIMHSPLVILKYEPTMVKTDYYKILEKRFDAICYPKQACAMITEEIKEHYSDKEVRNIILSHQVSDEECSGPTHLDPYVVLDLEPKKIIEINGVYEYDVNKAYCSGYATTFPKLLPFINYWNNRGKQDKHYKQFSKDLFNLSIGCFRQKEGVNRYYYDKFPSITPEQFNNYRNWIVQRTDDLCIEKQNSLNGNVIYWNTDGFIVKDPKLLEDSDTELGKFKRVDFDNNRMWLYKYEGDENYNAYYIMQWFENGEKVIKNLGGFLQDEELVNLIDLSQGKVAKFKTTIENGHKKLVEVKGEIIND